jgi:serine/threonine protein kinase
MSAPQNGRDDAATGAHVVGGGTPSEAVFQAGDVVASRFRIVRYLARGGMGELYEAEDLELHERVALKTILSNFAANERSIQLFKREVHLARQVTHPNVCRIYDVFRHRVSGAGGPAVEVVFLAMELLHGETLADKLRRDGRFETTEILPIARQMAAGLAAAHRVGVVHRDFKSHNVMLVKPNAPEQEVRVVVTDFGLARRSADDGNTAFSLSFGADEISGTPAYMAPEQVEGGAVTPATDIYAFGVVLYELLTGVWPFMAETPMKMAIKRLQEPPPPPSVHLTGLDPRWEATILRCLARQPADRFANITEAVASLERVEDEAGESLSARIARGPLPVDEAIRIGRQVAEALEAAHDTGVIHRDVRPANIRVREDGTVKLLNFGAARSAARAGGDLRADVANSSAVTVVDAAAAGFIIGTAAYVSPEQARGQAVDARTDIWAFGCVVYEMLTGRAAFGSGTATEVMASVLTNDPDWARLPADIPPSVIRLLHRCLRKDPRQRLRAIGDARLELSDSFALETADAARGKPARGRQLALAGAVALLASAVGVLAGMRWQQSRAVAPVTWGATRLPAPSTVLFPRLAPDGELVAFQTMVDGQSQIAVMQPNSGNWRTITTDRRHGMTVVSSWSSDGSRIYYDRQTDVPTGVFAVPALGGDARLVLADAGYPSVMSDGTLIVVRINADRRAQLHRFWPSTGRIDPLPAVVDTAASDAVVAALPDAKHVAFIGQPLGGDARQPGLYLVDVTSGRVDQLAKEVAFREPAAVAVHPVNGTIFFGTTQNSAFRILRVNPVATAVAQVVLTLPSPAIFDVARDGRLYIAFRDRPVELFTMTSDDPSAEPLATSPIMSGRDDPVLTPLPDGRVVVASGAAGRDRLLAVGRQTPPVPLVETDENTRGPVTVLDNTQAALMIGTAPDIAVVAIADGRLVRRMKAPSPNIEALAASPDGTTMYYAAGGSIWAMPSSGGEPRKMAAGDSVTVDPDSGDLIVKLDEAGRFRLTRVTPGGAQQSIDISGDMRLTYRPLMPGAIRGQRLLLPLATQDSWPWHIGVLDLRTRTMIKLRRDNLADYHLVTWGADGRILALALGLQTSLWRFDPE